MQHPLQADGTRSLHEHAVARAGDLLEQSTGFLGRGHGVRLAVEALGVPERRVPDRHQHVDSELGRTLAAVAAARALGLPVGGAVDVHFSSLRGEIVELPGGVVVVNDCYNANPMSMRAALDHLADSPAERRIAVLGTMAELGAGSAGYHREIGERAAELGIDVLVTVGDAALGYTEGFDGETHAVATPEEAGALLEEVARPGDRVLIKGSRSVGLERVLS